jgi:hypothetical protein
MSERALAKVVASFTPSMSHIQEKASILGHAPTLKNALSTQKGLVSHSLLAQTVQMPPCHGCLLPTQAKLIINKPGDKYEQEADRIADQIMKMPEPRLQRQVNSKEYEAIQAKPLANQITPLVQKNADSHKREYEDKTLQTKSLTGQILPIAKIKEKFGEDNNKVIQIGPKLFNEQISPLVQRQADYEDEKDEKIIQAKGDLEHVHKVSQDIEANINALQTRGQPLTPPVLAFFETSLGHDFSQVRVHSYSRAAQMARSINAKAFTIGKDIIFGEGHYSLRNNDGKRLLAHELTHVIQQSGFPSNKFQIQRKTQPYVWAHRLGRYEETNKYKVVPFYNFNGLLKSLEGYNKSIEKLYIVAHGNMAGVVDIPLPEEVKPLGKTAQWYSLSAWTIDSFAKKFSILNAHLKPDADVIFDTCISALGCAGSYLLKRISEILDGKRIIGFTTFGSFSSVGEIAGNVWETGTANEQDALKMVAQGKKELQKKGLRDINGPYAKHALKGKIIKHPTFPVTEINLENYCTKYKETEVKRDIADLLKYLREKDQILYYFAILFTGWNRDEDQEKKRIQNKQERAKKEDIIRDSYRIGMDQLEKGISGFANKEDPFSKIRYKALKSLDKGQQQIYERLKKAQLKREGRIDIAQIWERRSNEGLSGTRKEIDDLVKSAGIRISRSKAKK